KNIRFQGTPFSDEANGGMKVTIELAARENAIYVARTINLELVDSILTNELQSDRTKAGEVFRAGKREATCIHFKALLASVFHALHFGFVITSPRGKPDTRSCTILSRCYFQRCKPVGKAGIK